MSMLRYGQDSVNVMTAYSAVFLLKLLRSYNTLSQLHDGTAQEIHNAIIKTADAYSDAAMLSVASTSASYHARFLRSLVANDTFKSKWNEPDYAAGISIDPRLQAGSKSSAQLSPRSQPQVYSPPVAQSHDQPFQFPASPHLPSLPQPVPHDYPSDAGARPVSYAASYPNSSVGASQHGSELDAHYWRNMFLELGFGEGIDSTPTSHNESSRTASYHGHQSGGNVSSGLHYHALHGPSQPNYGH